jgi:hypothetical protein
MRYNLNMFDVFMTAVMYSDSVLPSDMKMPHDAMSFAISARRTTVTGLYVYMPGGGEGKACVFVCACVCVRACVRPCVRPCVRACVRASVRACSSVRARELCTARVSA